MDPFAPDSDHEDEINQPKASSSRSTDGKRVEQRNESEDESMHIEDRDDLDEDDGPPASIVLDTHDQEIRKSAISNQRLTNATPSKSPNARQSGTNTISDSVRLSRIRTPQGNANVVADDDDESDGIEEPMDEEAGLMNSPRASTPSSSTSRRRHERDKGMLSRIKRKIQKGADRIRAQDSAENSSNGSSGHPVRRLNAKERALWNWGTLENMDEFLQEVYGYYVGKGLICILLTKLLNLLTIAFVIGFSTFLVGCVDYSKIKHDGQLSDVVVHQCISRFSGITVLAFALFVGLYAWQVIRFGLGISKLIAMRDFYTHLLNVPDADVQSISWHDVVSRIAHLRETHPTLSLSSSQNIRPDNSGKLDAHDVANRIMRQENYLVALFNKDVLDLSIPIFGLQKRTPELTRTLEWNLTFCLLGFLFDHRGQVRKQFVTERHRKDLIEGLKRRFIFMAIVNAVFAPFIVIYLLFYSFFRYFEEYHKNPSSLGARQYTQFARWKFREFNELPHIFRRRCHNSYPYAQRYIDQFPKERIAIIARFVSFVAGSFTAVLLLASVLDPDLFVHFDITYQRNVLFYIGIFGAILAVSRAMVPDEQQVFEPEVLLRAVIEYTHHLPEHWKGRFHSAEVHSEFGTMYRLKISIFISEVLSVIFTPFILWKSLPRSAPGIIDFFREFTVHVDGLGYVCSFAVFDFKLQGNTKNGKGTGKLPSHHDRLASNQMKMEQSLLGFRAANPNWHPSDPSASMFLSRIAAEMSTSPTPQAQNGRHFATSPPPAPVPIGKLSGLGTTTNASGGVAFTPANSTLAQKSQLYNEAFDRSILLASKPSNAVALQQSAIRPSGQQRSVPTNASISALAHHAHRSGISGGGGGGNRRLQAVNEDLPDLNDQEGFHENQEPDPLASNGMSMYEDARPEHVRNNGSMAGNGSTSETGQPQPADLRGLLQHIGTTRW
ncbi:hypothetical protein L7F22_053983 [Adiantum nelumboides]|nr:hypothetical protein [Adiantum nelumboides]